jgi:AcrR family transcriptional regulator
VPPAKRRFRGKTADERKRERREKLVEAGLSTFGTRGFHGVGVRDICAEAQLTERYFYESFRNREELFLAVYGRCVAQVRAATDTALAELGGADLAKLARAGLRAFFVALREDPRMSRVLLIDVLTINPDVGQQSRLAVEAFADLVAELASTMYPDLLRRGLDPRLIGTGLVGATVFLAVRWASDDFGESIDAMVEHAACFYEGVVAS